MGAEVNGEEERRKGRWTERHRQTVQVQLPLEIKLKILWSLQRTADLPAGWLWSTNIKAACVFQDQNQAPRLSDMVGIHTYFLISYLKCKFFFTWASREKNQFLGSLPEIYNYIWPISILKAIKPEHQYMWLTEWLGQQAQGVQCCLPPAQLWVSSL